LKKALGALFGGEISERTLEGSGITLIGAPEAVDVLAGAAYRHTETADAPGSMLVYLDVSLVPVLARRLRKPELLGWTQGFTSLRGRVIAVEKGFSEEWAMSFRPGTHGR